MLSLRAQRNHEFWNAYNDTLIVCHDRRHQKQIIEAFKVPANYCTMFTTFVGLRYRTIIVFGPTKDTTFSDGCFKNVIAALKTRLMPNGRLFVI